MFRTLVVVLFALSLPAMSVAFDVTSCGQVVPPHQTGVLQVDLTGCSSATGVFLDERSTLELNGHEIADANIGVHCGGKRCTVHGPGVIRNSASFGILASGANARVTVTDAAVRDNGLIGIGAINGRPTIIVERVQVTGNVSGIEVIFKGVIKGKDVDASNNSSYGIVAGSKFRFQRLTLLNTAGGDGLVCIYGNGRISDSTVTGSGGADIATRKRPHVVNSTCGTSRGVNPDGPPWGVCTND